MIDAAMGIQIYLMVSEFYLTILYIACLQLDPLILSCVKGNAVVLDGELVVWNKARYGLSPI